MMRTSLPSASISSLVDKLQRESVTHTNRKPLLAAIMLSATPRFPDEDSTRTESGVSTPARQAASTISAAAFSLTEPAKLKPRISGIAVDQKWAEGPRRARLR